MVKLLHDNKIFITSIIILISLFLIINYFFSDWRRKRFHDQYIQNQIQRLKNSPPVIEGEFLKRDLDQIVKLANLSNQQTPILFKRINETSASLKVINIDRMKRYSSSFDIFIMEFKDGQWQLVAQQLSTKIE